MIAQSKGVFERQSAMLETSIASFHFAVDNIRFLFCFLRKPTSLRTGDCRFEMVDKSGDIKQIRTTSRRKIELARSMDRNLG